MVSSQSSNYLNERITLPATVMAILKSVGSPRTYEKGEIIHQVGDAATSICIVDSGRISGFTMNRSGKSGNAYVLGPGAAFGLFPLLAGRPRSHNCEAIEKSTLIHVGRSEIWRLIDDDREIRHQIFNYLCDRLSFAYDALDEERYLPLSKRLAIRLDEFANENNDVLLTQQQLADQMGVSRVALGNALKTLAELGFAQAGYGKIRLVNRKEMSQWSK